jgi:hypothetical protein
MTTLYNIGDFVGIVERAAIAVRIPSVWYMLRLHPNYDLKAERQLIERGRSPYVPKEQKSKSVGWGRSDRRWLPIFPGAMFIPDCDADLPALKRIADGIGGFVKVDGQALKVSLSWMERIRAFEAKIRSAPPSRKYRVGQEVRIVGGVWDLWEGKIASLDPHDRITILIDAIAGEVPVELDEDQVEAV